MLDTELLKGVQTLSIVFRLKRNIAIEEKHVL